MTSEELEKKYSELKEQLNTCYEEVNAITDPLDDTDIFALIDKLDKLKREIYANRRAKEHNLENLEKNLQTLKDERLQLSEKYSSTVDNPYTSCKDKLDAILEVWKVDKKIVQGKIDIVLEHLLTSDFSELDEFCVKLTTGSTEID